MTSKIKKFCQNLTPDMVIFDHFGGQNVIFWTFSKLFWSCLGSVRALFLDLKGHILAVFLAQSLIIDLESRFFFFKFWLF